MRARASSIAGEVAAHDELDHQGVHARRLGHDGGAGLLGLESTETRPMPASRVAAHGHLPGTGRRSARTAASTVRGDPGGVGHGDPARHPSGSAASLPPARRPGGRPVGRRRHRQDHGVTHAGTGRAEPPGQDVGHEPVGAEGSGDLHPHRV